MADLSNATPSRKERSWLPIVTLVFAGEAIFFLPFVIARVFRPTLLEVFEINNFQLGVAFSVYGIVAMLSYFPGGLLADRFGARRLMALALVSTAAGGLVLAEIPGPGPLRWLYAFWGLSTILVFWAALIRATRCWGGEAMQGQAFGLLDGGRGLVAAGLGSVAVFCYSWFLPDGEVVVPLAQRMDAFRQVIYIFTVITFLSALLVWFALPAAEVAAADAGPQLALSGLRTAAGMPVVWVQAVIIICAYAAYKGLDDVSLYARDALGFDEVSAAHASTVSMWMRPVAAIGAGLIADRVRVTTVTCISFIVLLAGSHVIAAGVLRDGMVAVFFFTIAATSAAVFALRGLYFAIMREGRVPLRYTGSAVGIVSAIGYTPDIFMGPLMGVLLDASPGATGHQHVFSVIAAFSLVGVLATLVFQRFANRPGPVDGQVGSSQRGESR